MRQITGSRRFGVLLIAASLPLDPGMALAAHHGAAATAAWATAAWATAVACS